MFVGTDADKVIFGDANRDRLVGNGGDDRIFGKAGQDFIRLC